MSTSIERTIPHARAATAGRRSAAIAGWTTTAVFGAVMTVSGVSFLLGPPPIVAMLHHLGYPPYLRGLLGIAKLLGVAALLIPGPRMLREWAYAGFGILFAGAISSHLLAGDGPGRALPAALVAALLLASHRLRRRAHDSEGTHD
jgi:hypothetical protein